MSERKRIARIFKMRGLSIQSSALDALLNVLAREKQSGGPSSSSSSSSNNDTLFAIIDEIKDRINAQSSSSSTATDNIVTTSLLEHVVAELSRDAKDVTDEAVQLLDAFSMPQLEFDTMRKQFSLTVDNGMGSKGGLYGEAVDKVCLYYCVVWMYGACADHILWCMWCVILYIAQLSHIVFVALSIYHVSFSFIKIL